jgi:lipopolysaccharide transport system ATP-binding protein
MISVENVSKKFSLYNSPADRLKEILFKKSFHDEYQALKNISFSINKGETLGIIGENGAGKTTLLKVVMGVLLPDNGIVKKTGKITGLLALGTGFKHELSGRKNIYINGMLIGMDKKEIDQKIDEIIDFTELGDFIDEPLKIYSSGMLMRLAFSIAYHAEPECFIIDEALSVGDAHFQLKSKQKLAQYKENGGSVIFVSHDMNAIKVLCDKALLLHKGEVVECGEPDKIVNLYNMMVSKANKDTSYYKNFYNFNNQNFRHGSMEAEITDINIKGEKSNSNFISSGENVIITVKINSNIEMENVSTGIMIRDKYGQNIYGTNLQLNNKTIHLKENAKYFVSYIMNMDIGPGKYTISAAIHQDPKGENKRLFWVDNFIDFEILIDKDERFAGICKLNPSIKITEELS